MPLTPANLRQPEGPLSPSYFPKDDEAAFVTRLQAYLDQAYAQSAARGLAAAEEDRAALAWAEYRAYDAIFKDLSRQEASAQAEGQGSRTYAVQQIENWRTERDEALARHAALLPPLVPGRSSAVSAPTEGVSTTTPLVFGW